MTPIPGYVWLCLLCMPMATTLQGMPQVKVYSVDIKAIDQLDKDRDGRLSLDEFMQGATTADKTEEKFLTTPAPQDILLEHEDVQTFHGNQTHSNEFKLLKQDGFSVGYSVLVGAKNVVYNVSLDDLEENVPQRITWNSDPVETDLCLLKGRSQDECHNFIRVLQPQPNNSLLVCGTNAFSPKCRTYVKNRDHVYEVLQEFDGRGYSPYNPILSNTLISLGSQLFSGATADFMGLDPLIMKGGQGIRTEAYNHNQLNTPEFVGSMGGRGSVYFFFREKGLDESSREVVYSRVARICQNDKGYRRKWTSFLKADLDCSLPGSSLKFTQLQSLSQPMPSPRGGLMVYGVFNAPENSSAGSAVCSFSTNDFQETFNGALSTKPDTKSYTAQQQSQVLKPASCDDLADLEEAEFNYIKDHSLMEQAVPSSSIAPHNSLAPQSSIAPNTTLTAITVQGRIPRVFPRPSGQTADVLYIGTNTGQVLKVSLYENQGKPVSRLVEQLQVFPPSIPVDNIQIVRGDTDNPRILVLSRDQVKSLPVARCRTVLRSCYECVALQDPFCGWNKNTKKCENMERSTEDPGVFLQSIASGYHTDCSSQDH